jgi:hypothetical protein
MEQLTMTPARMAHVQALAGLQDDYPEDAEILALSPSEAIEFARLTGFDGMRDYLDHKFLLLLPELYPGDLLTGPERVLAEQSLLVLMRAYVAVWPEKPAIKRARRKG